MFAFKFVCILHSKHVKGSLSYLVGRRGLMFIEGGHTYGAKSGGAGIYVSAHRRCRDKPVRLTY
jgi:hypothetical protein